MQIVGYDMINLGQHLKIKQSMQSIATNGARKVAMWTVYIGYVTVCSL